MSRMSSAFTRTAYEARSNAYWLRQFSPTLPGTAGWTETGGSLGAPWPFKAGARSIIVPAIPSNVSFGAMYLRTNRNISPAAIPSRVSFGPLIVQGPLAVFAPPQDTLRGGAMLIVSARVPLVTTRDDAALTGAVLPLGWTSATTGSGSVLLTDTGPLLDTGPLGNASASLTLTASTLPSTLPDNFDLALDVAPLLPTAVPVGPQPVTLAVLEFATTGGVVRVGLLQGFGSGAARTQVYAFGEPGGTTLAPLPPPATPGVWTLRLVRAYDRLFGFVGLRRLNAWGTWSGGYSAQVQVVGGVFGLPFAPGAAVQLVLRVANVATTERIMTQVRNYTVRSNVLIAGRLLAEPRRDLNAYAFAGIVPPATVPDAGAVDTRTFGAFGVIEQPGGFTYTLPNARTVGRSATTSAVILSDPALKDGGNNN